MVPADVAMAITVSRTRLMGWPVIIFFLLKKKGMQVMTKSWMSVMIKVDLNTGAMPRFSPELRF